MKIIKKIISFFFVICLIASIFPTAFAENNTADTRFKGKSWEEIIDAFFVEKGIYPEQVALGYYNTVTGEEHFHQPDKYMIGASIYKVPLNMAYAEKIYNGEMDWDSLTPYEPYEPLMQNSIIYSDNEDSGTLMFNLGGTYRGFLNYIARYLGVDTENVDPQYYNERYTARQYITCLKTLYHESERFPKIIETMLQAEPENYFRYSERRYDIAHKYGWWQQDWTLHVNDVGIVYTDDPIVIVAFTAGVGNATQFLSDYCSLMCDYTQYHRQQRLKAEAEEAAALKAAFEMAIADTNSKALVSETIEVIPAEIEIEENNSSSLPLYLAIVFVALIAIIILFSRKFKLKKLLIFFVILICAISAVLCLFANSWGTVFARPDGDPQETVSGFFNALKSGDYELAYSHIYGYSSLGLEYNSSDAVTKKVYDALKASYEYELTGACMVDKLSASQQVQLSHLEIPSLKGDVSSICIEKLEEIVMERSKAEVYDENKNFLPTVTAEAFELAVDEVLESAEKYCVKDSLVLQLEYKNDRWLIIPDAALIHALSGGITN